MRIRWKLLVILLVVALPPLGLATWFHQNATRGLASDLAIDQNRQIIEWSETYVRSALANQARLVRAQSQLLETELRHQIQTVYDGIAASNSGKNQSVINALTAVGETSGLSNVFRRYVQIGLSTVVLSPNTTKVVSDSPFHQVIVKFKDRRMPDRLWVRQNNRLFRLAPIPAVPGGVSLFSGPIFTAIEVDSSALLKDLSLPDQWSGRIVQYAVAPTEEDDPILFANTGRIIEKDQLAGVRAGMLVQARNLAPGQSRVTWQLLAGEEHLIGAARPIDSALVLMLAVPKSIIMADAQSGRQELEKRLNRVLAVSGAAFVIFAVAIFILSVIGARSITGPLHVLADAVARAASGDLNARAELHTGDEVQEVADKFNGMLPKLRDQIRMRDSLEMARDIQENLLPSKDVGLPGFDFAGLTVYCDETGGDYYDFLPVDDADGAGSVVVAIGDVAGHGISAALVMTIVRSLLHVLLPGARSISSGLADMLRRMNHELVGDSHQGRFVTLFVGELRANTRTFRWVNAGHEPGLLFDPPNDNFRELEGAGIPLGIVEDWDFGGDQSEILKPGNILVLVTDGIIECRNDQDEQFGRERLRQLIRDDATDSANDLCVTVAQTIARHQGARKADDDATIVVIKAA